MGTYGLGEFLELERRRKALEEIRLCKSERGEVGKGLEGQRSKESDSAANAPEKEERDR